MSTSVLKAQLKRIDVSLSAPVARPASKKRRRAAEPASAPQQHVTKRQQLLAQLNVKKVDPLTTYKKNVQLLKAQTADGSSRAMQVLRKLQEKR